MQSDHAHIITWWCQRGALSDCHTCVDASSDCGVLRQRHWIERKRRSVAEQYSTVSIKFYKYEYEYEHAQLRYYGLPPAALLTSPPNYPSSANPSIPNSFPTFSLHLPLQSQPRLISPMRQRQHISPLRRTQRLPHPRQRPRLQGGLCRREGTTTAAAV